MVRLENRQENARFRGSSDERERLGRDAPEYTVWAGTGCFDMLMGAWMGRWAWIKGMQDPRGTGRRMLVGRQTGDEALGTRTDP